MYKTTARSERLCPFTATHPSTRRDAPSSFVRCSARACARYSGARPLRDFRRRDASSARTACFAQSASGRRRHRVNGSAHALSVVGVLAGVVTHPPARRALAVIERARPMTGHKWASSKRAGAARRKLPIIFFICS